MPNTTTAIEMLARAGYSARGAVYLIIGFFAALAAFGASEKTGPEGALDTLLRQPFGTVLVWVVIVGLLGYALWRTLQAVMDTDRHGLDLKGIVIRIGLACSAATYLTLALYALSLAGMSSGSGGGGGGGGVARIVESFVGARIVSLVLALIFGGIAIAHWWKAWKRGYRRYIQADGDVMRIVDPVSRIGLSARGLVFAIIATLSLYRFAGSEGGGGSSPGLEEALQFIQDMPFGWLLLTVMGLGLIAFAFYSFAEAIWRRVNVEQAASTVRAQSRWWKRA